MNKLIQRITYGARNFCNALQKENLISINQNLKELHKKLKAAGVGNREFNLQCLIKRVLRQNIDTQQIKLESVKLTLPQYEELQKLCNLRCDRVPLQHLMGEWPFLNLMLKTKPSVFIPRPETEEFVAKVIEAYRNIKDSINMLEVGCGSGAMSLAIIYNIPTINSIAFDCCPDATELAKENALRLHLEKRFKVFCHKMTKNDYLPKELEESMYDLIIGNPPFARPDEMSMLSPEVLRYENREALDGGPDGLRIVRLVLQMACYHLRPGGKLWLELGSDQPPLLKTVINLQYDQQLRYVNAFEDSLGRERFVEIEKPKSVK